MTPFRILPMQPDHVKTCREIVAASDPWKRLGRTVDFRAALTGRPAGTQARVCLIDGRPAGFVLFIPEPVFALGGYLRALGVASRFRGQGVGGALLARAEQETSLRSRFLYLCVSSFNRRGQAFYRRCGYSRAGSFPGLIIPGAAEYVYWKRLAEPPVRGRNRRP